MRSSLAFTAQDRIAKRSPTLNPDLVIVDLFLCPT